MTETEASINSDGPPVGGAWVAHYSDGSSFAVFAAEVEAYRYALPLSMRVTFLPYGVEIRDHENALHPGGNT